MEWSGGHEPVQGWLNPNGTSMLVNMPEKLAQKMQVGPSAEL